MTLEQPKPERSPRCEKCGRMPAEEHKCNKDNEFHYLCKSCLSIHRTETGEPAGFLFYL